MVDPPIATCEVEIEINTPVEKFFNMYTDHVILFPQVLPDIFKSSTVVKGDGKSVGSIVDLEYILEPPTIETTRQTIEAIDKENMVLAWNLYGGDLGKKFDIYRPVLKVYNKGPKNYLKRTLDYKKTNDKIPEPHNYMKFVEKYTKEFDSRIANVNLAE
ncbi:hypothetical protein NE237_006396 [Protea cynaroides]|uniref:Bet v I/Major latex protein domain-containing protein n=1 Tax=Protea cynaroides TaxID=273540 RepID=A0A9Q0KMA2_9MAGN|nr:hypothetical protein NE237_006396 [Protea cynaroides]